MYWAVRLAYVDALVRSGLHVGFKLPCFSKRDRKHGRCDRVKSGTGGLHDLRDSSDCGCWTTSLFHQSLETAPQVMLPYLCFKGILCFAMLNLIPDLISG